MKAIVLTATASSLLTGLFGVLLDFPAHKLALSMLITYLVGVLLGLATSSDE